MAKLFIQGHFGKVIYQCMRNSYNKVVNLTVESKKRYTKEKSCMCHTSQAKIDIYCFFW